MGKTRSEPHSLDGSLHPKGSKPEVQRKQQLSFLEATQPGGDQVSEAGYSHLYLEMTQ